ETDDFLRISDTTWDSLKVTYNIFFFSRKRRQTMFLPDRSSDVCSSDLLIQIASQNLSPEDWAVPADVSVINVCDPSGMLPTADRSEERRVGKECRFQWSSYNQRRKDND